MAVGFREEEAIERRGEQQAAAMKQIKAGKGGVVGEQQEEEHV
jgi:hypothetical protein